MRRLLVVYHTQSGSTARLAQAAFAGAREEEGATTCLARAMEAGAAELRAADGVLFCTPENFGALSGGMKDFLDRTFYAVSPEGRSRAYGLIVSAGNDGSGAVRQLERIVRGYPMRAVAAPLIVHGEPRTADLEAARELGAALAAGLALGIF
jgi:multimeric flavodoxin WrbA